MRKATGSIGLSGKMMFLFMPVLFLQVNQSRMFAQDAAAIYSTGFEEQFGSLQPPPRTRAGSSEIWRRAAWGRNVVQFTGETNNPHSGEACLVLKSLRWHSGMAATISPRFRVEKGKKYVLRLWLRAEAFPATRCVAVTVRNTAVQDVVPLPGQMPLKKWFPHAKRRCSASGEWQEYTLSFAPEHDADVQIHLGFESVGTLWIDDVSITEGSQDRETRFWFDSKTWVPASPSKEPPRKGNLIYNGSFEAGTSGWGPLTREIMDVKYNRQHFGDRRLNVTREKTDTAYGAHALRFDLSGDDVVWSEYIKARPGQKLTLSAYMKAEEKPTRATLAFHDGTQIQYVRFAAFGTKCELTTEWQRFSVSGRLPRSANNGVLALIMGSDDTFLVDGVQLEEGDLTPFAPGAEAELGSSWRGSVTGVYRPGQESGVRVYASGKPDSTLEVESRLEDYYGKVRETLTSRLKLDAKGNGEVDLDIELPAPGIYRLVSDARGTKRPAELILVQVKRAHAGYGGIQTQLYQRAFNAVKDSGFGWWRLSAYTDIVGWHKAVPEKGKYVYFDESLALVLSTGVKPLGTLGGYNIPKWASEYDPKDPDSIVLAYGNVINIDDWKDYVGAMVGHYKDRIRHWEIWNEPGMPDPAHYVRLIKEASLIIKRVDPEAKVIGGSTLTASTRAEKMMDLGVLDYLDGWTFHGYCTDGYDPWEFGRGLQELMKEHGKVLPFWDTEWGVHCSTFRRVSYYGGQTDRRWPARPYRAAVNMLMRHELSGKALGEEANFWFLLDRYSPMRNNSGALMTMMEYDNSARAILPALANSWDLLGEAELVEMLQPDAIAARLYTFNRPDGVLFAVDVKLPEGLAAELVLPLNRNGERINVMGERTSVRPRGKELTLVVSDEPVFVLFEGAEPADIAAAAKAARFVGMPPAEASRLLAIDPRNQAFQLLQGSRYEKEFILGFNLKGWLFRKADSKLMVFAGKGTPGNVQMIPVTGQGTVIYDSLQNRVTVDKGEVEIANDAPYIAVGANCEKSIGVPQTGGGTNLLENPSFEEGREGETPLNWSEWTRFSGDSTFVKEKGGRTPERTGMAVLIQSPNDQFVYASQAPPCPLKAGERYGFEVWLRSDHPIRADVCLEARSYDEQGNSLGTSGNCSRYKLTPEWRRCTTTVVVEEGRSSSNGMLRVIVQVSEKPDVRVEIDDVVLKLIDR